MGEYLQYETCPFCSRKFFRGKLAYHLKLCNNDNPMLINPKPKKSHFKNSQSTLESNYERCHHCNTKLPKFMLEKHCKNCSVDQLTRKNFRSPDIHEPKKKSNEVNLPRIRNSARESADRRNNLEVKKPLSSVKIREDLRCFRKAEEVPKVLCENCGRKFAEKAALRHLPVCEKLRKK